MNKLEIRTIANSDLPAVYRLVKELAKFEKELDKVITSVEIYQQLFTEKLYGGHIALVDDTVVGMAIYYPMFSTWTGKLLYLEDFYVQPGWRSQGIGQQLWDTIVQSAKTSGYKGMKWQVLDWNSRAIHFYKRNGADIEMEWYNGRLSF